MTPTELMGLLGDPPARVSDLHFRSGRPVALRCDGTLARRGETVLTEATLEALIGLVRPDIDLSRADRSTGCTRDFGFSVSGVRYRGQLSRVEAGQGWLLTCRLLARDVPGIEMLGLPTSLLTWLDQPAGLIVVAGATGSGKSTTLASLVEWVNAYEQVHIVTLEDPIEYRFVERRACISQREVGVDEANFTAGAYAALRSDADVILIGELREPEAARAALALAESGHRVLTTVHAASAVSAIDRLLALLGGHEAALRDRSALAEQLIGGVCQHLVPVLDDERRSRLLLYDTVSNLPTVTAAIREDRVVEIGARIQAAGNRVNQYEIVDSIAAHLAAGRISAAEAARLRCLHEGGGS
jgi:twitching motility protein PilT